MASDETVAEIKYRIYSHWRGCENCSLEELDGADLIAIADQFEAAHKRELAAKDAEIAELRECLRLSSNCMGMVVQWLGRYPAWQRCLTNGVARNRKFLEATKGAEDDK